MNWKSRGILFIVGIVSSILVFGAGFADTLPDKLSDAAFWKLIADLSEPTDRYPGNNFTSNENEFQYVIPELLKTTKPGGVYFGVAPEQNFTFIAAVKPKIAFIIDIRRQNMMEMLMYKAVFEASADRVEFVSRLFGRKRPSGITQAADAVALFKAFDSTEPDQPLFDSTLQMIKDRLVQQHGFKLDAADLSTIEFIYSAFYKFGPKLNWYGGGPTPAGASFADYEGLMTADDGRGVRRSYLENEANFRVVKELEENNLIIPLVGDFTGSRTMRAAGQYVREHSATVETIYASSVEFVTFRNPGRGAVSGPVVQDRWKKYYDNLAALPLSPASVLIRDAVLRGSPPISDAMVTQPVANLIQEFNQGKLNTLDDMMHLSKCGAPISLMLGCQP